jgi:transcriptional regulator with XRE-family HTH domain
MDRLRLGRSLRALRIRLGWRQSDGAVAAGVSRAFISKVERGQIRHSDLDRLERVCQALGADLDVRVRWRGEALDRLLDEAHAALVDRMVSELRAAGWEAAVEVTFNEFGDRGSVDIAGWHPDTRSILIVEVKSVVADAQGTLLPLDRKARLAPKIGRSRGWEVQGVSKLLVIADGSTNRGRVARLTSMFDAALPVRNREVRRWLRSPVGTIAGLLFLPDAPPGSARRRSAARQRVNRPSRALISPGRPPRVASGQESGHLAA